MLKEIHSSWKTLIKDQFSQDYFKILSEFVTSEYNTRTIYPTQKEIFKAFDLCPFNKTKVIIIGQDPYHGLNQANGLSFAVHKNIPLPPSLKNIFKEIESDVGIKPEQNGDLSRFATQGVLLLNATLTVRAQTPGSHQNKGWEQFTDAVIKKLSDKKEHLVFILWGNYAKKKGLVIDRNKHCIIESSHPSPFSAHNGFFGSKPFSKTNEYLKKIGVSEIDWR
ncbi:uracil-DNA glycosylase [Arenimonas sp.]|nr:uracil-DNA glycosylase [Candidatus Parcubacteria bacterium]